MLDGLASRSRRPLSPEPLPWAVRWPYCRGGLGDTQSCELRKPPPLVAPIPTRDPATAYSGQEEGGRSEAPAPPVTY